MSAAFIGFDPAKSVFQVHGAAVRQALRETLEERPDRRRGNL